MNSFTIKPINRIYNSSCLLHAAFLNMALSPLFQTAFFECQVAILAEAPGMRTDVKFSCSLKISVPLSSHPYEPTDNYSLKLVF